ncbi:MAG: tRNA (N(6)-L-threonylcarbamoyladenosine(37)-C(2))-methylthiotransferase MtaB [Gemmatimonadota bacterium]
MPRARSTRVAVANVGCKLNQHETEALMDCFGRRGFEVVGPDEPADVVVVNTCTVTGSGDADSRRAVRRARRRNPAAAVVATGCYAQRRPDELRAAGADVVVGNEAKSQLVEHLEAHLRGEPLPALAPFPPAERFMSIEGAVPLGRTRGTLKIQDGCDEHCTYCIIPSVRGPGVSRPAAEVVDQARRMVELGYRELALTGVHSGSYGADRGDAEGLARLLERLEQVPGLERIRLNSVEPGSVTDALIEHAAASPRFCRHFHVPLQSGHDEVLRRMGRRHGRAHYAERIARIAERIPDCAIGADVMVGFPGEDEEHFAATRDLVGELPLTYLHVFSYSRRDGTPATRLRGQVSGPARSERSRQLVALGHAKRLAFHRRHLGRTVRVLVEDRTDGASGLRVGLTDNYIKVLFSAPAPVNGFVDLRVSQAREDVVFGEAAP